MPNSPIEISVKHYRLKINVLEDLRDNAWAAYFGDIQYILDNPINYDPIISEVLFDFTLCEWADPLPLLSIIISIAEFTNKGNKARVKLPSVKNATAKAKGFLKYLAKEGFAYQIMKYASYVFDDEGEVTVAHLQKYGDLSYELSYVNSTCMPAEIIDVFSTDVEKWVNLNLEYAYSRIESTISLWARENLFYRIKIFLRETLMNIKMHAYPRRTSGYAGVYIRYREGIANKNKEIAETLIKALEKESHDLNCPFLPLSYFEERQGCLELFVIDSGIGISESMRTVLRNRVGEIPNYPFPYACELVFNQGMRKDTTHKRSTHYGGLHLLAQLLRDNKDYLRGYDSDSWYGSYSPLVFDTTQNHKPARTLKHAKYALKGLSWTARISWLAESDTADSKIWKRWNSDVVQNPVLEVLTSDLPEPKRKSLKMLFVDDNRIKQVRKISYLDFSSDEFKTAMVLEDLCAAIKNDRYEIVQRKSFNPIEWLNELLEVSDLYGLFLKKNAHRKYSRAVDELVDSSKTFRHKRYLHLNEKERGVIKKLNRLLIEESYPTKCPKSGTRYDISKYIMVLPQRGYAKNDITKYLRELIDRLTSAYTTGNKLTAIIADIPVHESATYIAALKDSKFNKNIDKNISKISRIVLVNVRLDVCVLLAEDRGVHYFSFNESSSIQMYKKTGNPYFAPAQNISSIIEWLRFHDSYVLWDYLEKTHLNDNTYLNASIKWNGENKYIEGYLDFAQTLTDTFCKQLYMMNINRLPGLFSNKKTRMSAMDNLVKNLVAEINSAERFDGFEKITCVGSIQVSGFTEKASTAIINKDTYALSVHFFKHPNSVAKAHYIFLWPNLGFFKKKFPKSQEYERVGRTPVVARGGWKYYKLIRFDRNNKSIYKRSPRETYADFQRTNPTVMKIGHWVYESHHDLLTVNLWQILKLGFLEQNDLTCFLLSNLYSALALSENELTSQGLVWRHKIEEYLSMIDENRNSYLVSGEFAAIVYPSHPVSDFVMDRFKECVSSTSTDKIRRIIAVFPVKQNRGGSALLLSPLALERIQSCLNGFSKNRRILLFDDALVTGRTQKDLEHLLRGLGAEEVQIVTLLDRRRMPGQVLHDKRIKAYWRLDVPVLGTEMTCPLCRAIGVATVFSHTVNKRVFPIVDSWIKEWHCISPMIDWKTNGLDPTYFEPRNPFKKMSVEETESGKYQQIGGESEQILINRTSGIIAYVTELQTMTSRDDLTLHYCETEGTLNDDSKIELLASQLLLFGGEYDVALRNQMLSQLLVLASLKNHRDKYSSLAAFVLILQDNNILFQLLYGLINEEHEILRRPINEDIVIFLAYVMSNNISLKEYGFPNFVRAQRIIIEKYNDIASLYDTFHFEINSEFGRSHTKPLVKFIESEPIALDIKLTDVLDSLLKLRDIIKSLDPDIVRPTLAGGASEEPFIKFRQQLYGMSDFAYKVIHDLRGAKDKDAQHTDQAKLLIRNLLADFNKLHDRLFFRLNISHMNEGKGRDFEDNIEKLVSDISPDDWQKMVSDKKNASRFEKKRPVCIVSRSGKRFPDKARKEAWVIWDNKVVEVVMDLIKNVLHSSHSIKDPWGNNRQDIADMWIKVDYESNCLLIELANASDVTVDVLKGNGVGGRYWWHIEELSGSITYEQGIESVVFTKVLLPYVGKTKVNSNHV